MKTKQQETLPNLSEMTGSVCVQWRKSGGKLRPYYYRFWRENGRLRKQYVRLADLERVRAACEANRLLRKMWREEIASARRLYRSLIESLNNRSADYEKIENELDHERSANSHPYD